MLYGERRKVRDDACKGKRDRLDEEVNETTLKSHVHFSRPLDDSIDTRQW